MDRHDIRTLQVLEAICKHDVPSQRYLAGQLNISLGLVNSFIKRLARKGYFKVTTIPKNRIKYIITPKGAAEKTRLTYEYVQTSYQFYKWARQKLRMIFKKLESENVSNLVFYGANDFAEIAYVSIQETSLRLISVIDDYKVDNDFFDMLILSSSTLESLNYDRILITSLNSRDIIIEEIKTKDISLDIVLTLE